MKYARWVAALLLAYLLLFLVVFDFSEIAVPFDEETFGGRPVAIGPRPRAWIPGATHGHDIPGGADYAPGAWPFVVWKPLCAIYLKAKGYAPPRDWRQGG